MYRLRRSDVMLTHSDVASVGRSDAMCPATRAKRTSRPKHTSRTKCASRSHREHIVQPKNSSRRMSTAFFWLRGQDLNPFAERLSLCLPSCGARKLLSACSASNFRPRRFVLLAASATGGARNLTPGTRRPQPQYFIHN